MSVCITNPEDRVKFDALAQIVGEDVAIADMVRHDGLIRSPRAVIQDMQNDFTTPPVGENKSTDVFDSELFEITEEELRDAFETVINKHANRNSVKAIESFSRRLGIDYKFVDSHPSTNVNAFYSKGVVFFVNDRFRPDSVFHEFAHPFIKSLHRDNPELFDKLYQELIGTLEGESIYNSVVNNYKGDYEVDSLEFQFEVMVTAMTNANTQEIENRTPIGNILYAIKRFLRKIFGSKINLKNLSGNTKLKDLVEMLNLDEFDLDTDFLNMDDVIYMQKEFNIEHAAITKATAEKAQVLMNQYADLLTQQLNYLDANQEMMGFVGEELSGELRSGVLKDMSLILQQLRGTSVTVESKADMAETIQIGELTKLSQGVLNETQRQNMANRINTFAKQVAKIETVLDILENKINSLSTSFDINNNDQLKILFGIGEYLESYGKFLSKVAATDADFNPLFVVKANELLRKINEPQTGMLSKLNDMRIDTLVDVLYDTFVNTSANGISFYEERLAYLKKNATEADYNSLYKDMYGVTPQEEAELKALDAKSSKNRMETERLLELKTKRREGDIVSKEDFRAILLNEDRRKFGQAFNRNLESFLYNQDKIIGTFYTWFKNNQNEVNANATARQRVLLDKLNVLIKNAGYKANRHTLTHTIGIELSEVTDVGGDVNANGEIESNLERHYKSAQKNWKPDFKYYNNKVKDANIEYITNPSEQTLKDYYEAQKEFFYWKKENMYQDYVDIYYDAEELLWKDDIGLKAKIRLDEVLKEISVIGSPLDSLDDPETNAARNFAFQQLINLRSKLNADNTLKTGDELLIAERLQEYHKAINAFKTSTIDSELFNTHYQVMINQVYQATDEHGNPISSAERQEMIDKWIDENTVVAVTEDYFVQRSILQERRKNILAPIEELNQQIQDLSDLYDIVYELIRPTRDEKGQYNGKDLTIEQQILLRDTQQKIEDAKLNLYSARGKGLTGQEVLLYFDYWNTISSGGVLSQSEQEQYDSFAEAWQEGLESFGLTEEEIEELTEIEKQLSEMSQIVFTEHYLGVFQEYYNTNEEFAQIYNDFLEANFEDFDLSDNVIITDVALKELFRSYNDKFLQALKDSDTNFETFFNNNHIDIERMEEQPDGTNEIVLISRNTAVWQFSQPSSENFLKAHPVLDAQGNTVGVLRDRNNTVRIPNFNFQVRETKPEYQTEIVLRDYVDASGNLVVANKDHQGKWLPKETSQYRNQSYFDMFENDRAKWELLDYLKNWSLDNQERIEPSKRKGLAYPKMRQTDIENITRKGFWRRKYNRFKELFNIVEDDYELGLYVGRTATQTDQNVLDKMNRPISGLYANLDINEVSSDIIATEMAHMISLEENISLAKMYETGRTLERLLTGYEGGGLLSTYRSQLEGQAILSNSKTSQRAIALQKIMDRSFRGIQLDASPTDTFTVVANKLLPGIQKQNSFKYFFLQPIASLKNVGTQTFQTIYKWADFRNYVTPLDTSVGFGKATRAMAEYQLLQYSDKTRTAQMQLMDMLDGSPDKFRQYGTQVGSRNILKDIYQGRIGYYLRTTSTQHYFYHVMYAFMNNNKFRFKIDGRSYTLDQAIEIVDGRLQTIKGVPEEMSISYNEKGDVVYGEKINKLINSAQDYMQKVSGMSGQHGEGDFVRRNLLGKIIFSLMKYLPGMTMDRYEARIRYDKSMPLSKRFRLKRRLNWSTGGVQYGTLIRTLDLGAAIVESGFTGFRKNRFSYEHYTGLVQTVMAILVTELLRYVMLNVINFIFPKSFGDDDDKYYSYNMNDTGGRYNTKTLKELNKVAAPNLPWIADEYKMNEWSWGNFFKLQGLRLLSGLENENESFYVKPLLYQGANLIQGKTAFFAGAPAAIADFLAYYEEMQEETYEDVLNRVDQQGGIGFVKNASLKKRDPGRTAGSRGPYVWQSKNEYIAWSLISSYYGFKGYGVRPVLGLEQDINHKIPDTFNWSWIIGQARHENR